MADGVTLYLGAMVSFFFLIIRMLGWGYNFFILGPV